MAAWRFDAATEKTTHKCSLVDFFTVDAKARSALFSGPPPMGDFRKHLASVELAHGPRGTGNLPNHAPDKIWRGEVDRQGCLLPGTPSRESCAENDKATSHAVGLPQGSRRKTRVRRRLMLLPGTSLPVVYVRGRRFSAFSNHNTILPFHPQDRL